MNESDFPTFWLAAQVLLSGSDPTNPVELATFAQQHGIEPSLAIRYQGPPWSLAFLLLFAPFSLMTAAKLNMLGVTAWTWVILRSYPLKRPVLFLACALLATFLPLYDILQTGQITSIALLCIVGAYRLRRIAPFLAGLLVALSTIKLHLFLPLYCFLSAESIRRRQYQLFMGCICGISVQWAIVIGLCPASGFQSLGQSLITDYLNPIPGAYLHYFSGNLLLRFVPSIAGCVWGACLGYRAVETTTEELSSGSPPPHRLPAGLLLCGILTAPYAWTYDFIALMPTLLEILYFSKQPVLLAFGLAMLQALLFTVRVNMGWAVWYPIGMFALSQRSRRLEQNSDSCSEKL